MSRNAGEGMKAAGRQAGRQAADGRAADKADSY